MCSPSLRQRCKFMNPRKIHTTSPVRRKRNTIGFSDKHLELLQELFTYEVEYCFWWLEDHCGVTDLKDISAEHAEKLRKHLSEELFTNHDDFRTVLDCNAHIMTLNQICLAAGINISFAMVPFPHTEESDC